MSNHNTEKPKDGKNVEERDFLRYSFSSGQPSINGMTNFRVKSQEGQSFSFHSGTGIGGEQTGSGTGRAILSTPGLYEENLGDGLAFRSSPLIIFYQQNKSIAEKVILFWMLKTEISS